MSLTFDTQKAVQRLRASGVEEAHADATVAVMADATGALVTGEHLDTRLKAAIAEVRSEIQASRADVHHALLVLGLGLAGLVIGVAGVSLAAAALLFN